MTVSKEEKEARRKKQLTYIGDKLSLNFQDIEVRSVLQLLADFTGLNMVVSDSVGGRITLRLKNVPWDQALDIILKTKGLSKRQNGNVILVAPTEEIAAREKLDLESQKQVEELAPLHSELIQINYAKAEALAELLKSEGNQLLSERGNVTIDTRTNTLLVQDTATKLSEVRALVEKLDVPVKQVLVESRIVIANDDFARDIWVRFGFNRENSVGGNASLLTAGGLPGHTSGTFGFAPGIENAAGSGAEALMVNLPQQLSPGRGGAVNFLLGKVGSYLLQLELTAMQQEGRGEIVSSPRVITSDQNKATIKQGIEIPYQEATSSGATSVSFKEAVLKLEVTPHITPDDRIIMDLLVAKDDADFTRAVLGVPPLNKREVETRVLVDNGETVVLGGVFEREKKQAEEKVPFFGDLPVVGWAFKEKANQACLRPRDRFWDIPVPKIDSAFDNPLVPQPSWSPSTTQQLRKLVAAPYLAPNDWTPRSEAYFVFPLAQGTPGKQCGLAATGVYQPSLRSPWLAAKDSKKELLNFHYTKNHQGFLERALDAVSICGGKAWPRLCLFCFGAKKTRNRV
ncbi:type IV pilus secretin PilQ [Thiolapillus sp.]|uniref:type IV pilus secretin PilQ n=10 Tax=Thiolapillus sp. TaxID=2017437 RepID=UPI002739BA06|nr:type IV pilus secretin PilQ family protein [Thiolapillus sp.]